MLLGQLFRDEKGEHTALIDGVIASLFYAFDSYADKAVIYSTLARELGFEAFKNSRILLYQAFSLQDDNGRIPEKRTEETFLRRPSPLLKVHPAPQGEGRAAGSRAVS